MAGLLLCVDIVQSLALLPRPEHIAGTQIHRQGKVRAGGSLDHVKRIARDQLRLQRPKVRAAAPGCVGGRGHRGADEHVHCSAVGALEDRINVTRACNASTRVHGPLVKVFIAKF